MANVASREDAEPGIGGQSSTARGSQLLRDLAPSSWSFFRRDVEPAGPRGWRSRIPAEAEAAALLGQLGDEWTVIRVSDGVAVRGADFIVIGHSGVFSITAVRPTDQVRYARRY